MTVYDGRFFDGKSAKSHSITLSWRADSVELQGSDDNGLAVWALEDIRVKKQIHKGDEPRFFSINHMAAELVITESGVLALLMARCPDLHKKLPGEKGSWKPYLYWGGGAILSVVVIFWVVIPALSQQIAGMLPNRMLTTIGEKAEDRLAELFAAQSKKDDIRCENVAGQASLEKMTNRLLRAGGISEDLYAISVLNHKMANAFTLPGGRIVIMKGLIDLVDHPNGVAGVIAHEIAHAERRHPAGKMISAAGTTALFSVMLGDVTGGTIIAGVGQAMLGAAYGRDKEREADARAISLMQKAGLDLAPMSDLYKALGASAKLPDLIVVDLLSTHPGMAERLAMISEGTQASKKALSHTEWTALKNICQ